MFGVLCSLFLQCLLIPCLSLNFVLCFSCFLFFFFFIFALYVTLHHNYKSSFLQIFISCLSFFITCLFLISFCSFSLPLFILLLLSFSVSIPSVSPPFFLSFFLLVFSFSSVFHSFAFLLLLLLSLFLSLARVCARAHALPLALSLLSLPSHFFFSSFFHYFGQLR